MKINKKYNAKTPLMSFPKKVSSYYPIFLPLFEKIKEDTLTRIIIQSISQDRATKDFEEPVSPIFIGGIHTSGVAGILEGKEKLPLMAKLQRLSTHKDKIHTKQLKTLSQIFSYLSEIKSVDIPFSGKEIQNFIAFLSEKKFWKRADRVVYWDVSSQSIIQPDAIERREEQQKELEIKCFVETKNDIFPLVVDDPMLFFSDVGIVVHENDKRYKKYIGKKIIIPIINKSIPIFGEESIDTIKDNGIQRINPLLCDDSLQKTKELGLSINDEYIDEKGCFTDKVSNFGGKSVFDFTENIIETFSTIGNLLSQKTITRKIPYSKETGQRLIKRVMSVLVLDFSSILGDVQKWVNEVYPNSGEELATEYLVEGSGIYGEKMIFVDKENEINLFNLQKVGESSPNILCYLITKEIIKGHIPSSFSEIDISDMLFLLPKDEYIEEGGQGFPFSIRDIEETIIDLKTRDPDSLLDKIYEAISSCEWLKKTSTGGFCFDFDYFFRGGYPYVVTCNDSFLEAIALLFFEEEILVDLKMLSPQTRQLLFYFLFFKNKTVKLIENGKDLRYPKLKEPYSLQKYIDHFGWETIRMSLLENLSYEEVDLQQNFDYLKHLWNLFKTLYENHGFEDFSFTNELGGKELRLINRWEEFIENYSKRDFSTEMIKEMVSGIKDFTRKDFTRYLALVKHENNPQFYHIGAIVFQNIIRLLSPMIPEFRARLNYITGSECFNQFNKYSFHGQKDYKISLLFDVLSGVNSQREELNLKKHLPIVLAIQANSDILDLLQKYELSLKSLFKIEKVDYLTANESFPSEFHSFNILDITIGVKPYILTKNQDELMLWEKELKDKEQELEYVRSLLMLISLNPLEDPQKKKDREDELERIKDEIQHLEIKIQKAKMQRKG